MALWFVFLALSMTFTFGWILGSGIGYQNGRRDAEAFAELQTTLFADLQREWHQQPGDPVGVRG